MTRFPRSSLSSLAEAAVVELARAGDDGAFEELVRRRQARVRSLMRRLCGSASQADDLSQEAFMQAWRGIRSLQADAAMWTWLRRIAVRTWMREARRRRQPIETEALPTQIAEQHPSERLDLDAALGRLDPDVRTCVVLSYEVGMSHGEIAAATAIPLGTVKSHVARGSKILRSILNG